MAIAWKYSRMKKPSFTVCEGKTEALALVNALLIFGAGRLIFQLYIFLSVSMFVALNCLSKLHEPNALNQFINLLGTPVEPLVEDWKLINSKMKEKVELAVKDSLYHRRTLLEKHVAKEIDFLKHSLGIDQVCLCIALLFTQYIISTFP